MEVVLLGTGAADGWPNPFCTCSSCRIMLERGEIRSQTAALVDDVLLLDCGPEVPRAAMHAGRTLSGVRHLLLTHAHPDHVGPLALLMRSWVARDQPLDVIGPPEALDLCRDWVGPDDPVRWIPVAPGDALTVGEYGIRVLPAAHRVHNDGDCVLFEVAARGRKLLWATDTGPFDAVALDAVRDARYDAVFLEETFGDLAEHEPDHLDLVSFPRALAALRGVGAVVDGTDVIAVHLGHHNPVDLQDRLGPWGVRIVPDGTVVTVGDGALGASAPRRTLVLGGARAGKSTHAQRLLSDRDDVTYVATGAPARGDAEWAARIAAHRASRPGTWRTVETDDLVGVLQAATGPLLVDCLGTWLTRRIDTHGAWDDEESWAAVRADLDGLVAALRRVRVPVVVVSNEVGSGVVPATASGRRFRDALGRLNTSVAAECESVVLVVAGRPLPLR
ncbi:Adenosylcobinamide kinase [Rhodococcus sp. RD6.2]|jgi:adenosylcobinamide kinase/adenosylcobinamide-phosphate guanylyltransferase|uniref:bifunctional adenosylcobinamide kinase/adenosylcobinamide-phosphate guanylyltransferase n=1 Tax=Rhodococcus sp. RD6.2 TaxID=260936 RepID=UPI00063B5A54|nr:bifunctional adenosylcobinamide kinase/adenosylcobinamide-phosphate guanylyltransferase [Rhodococcus sp. RD6.2]CRK52335.1 Adenosylcobinamide kinase [Rhodococcus sp. RD6.2]